MEQYIKELSQGWNELKADTVRFIGLCKMSDTLGRMVETMSTCGEILAFRPDENGEQRFSSSWFCRNRLCPMCIKRRSLRQYAEACRLVEAMPQGTWLHLVLTIRSVSLDELGDAISRMNKASSEFFREKAIKRAFRGILRVLEVTYNAESDSWHPHFHCLIWAPKSYCTNPRLYLKHEVLLQMWRDAIGDQKIKVLYISKIKDPFSAIPEVVKYCFKPYEPDGVHGISELEFYESIYHALRSRRCIQTYGEIRKMVRELRIDLEGEEQSAPTRADDPGVLLLRYSHNKKRYSIVKD